MKVLFLTTLDPRTNPALWSGTTLSILRGLESLGHEVQVQTIGPTWLHWYGAIQYRIYRWFFGKQYMIDVGKLDLWANRRRMRKQLQNVSFDFVFSWLPWHLLLVETGKPKAFWYDTTFIKTHSTYYPNLCRESLRNALQLDRKVAREAAAAIYPSEWARQSAINDYGASPEHVHTIQFGANMAGPTPEQVADAIERRITRPDCTVRLLFVGMEWERKSGSTAVDVTREINRRGTAAKLIIVGCRPELPAADMALVEIHGRLNKTNPAELAKLKSLYLDCDFFVMTSRAESYGIVYCEAMSNGMPSLATNAGGVGQIVRSDVTGYLAEWGPNTVPDIAEFVVRTWSDPLKYRALAESSFRTFNAEFTWESNWKQLGLLLDRVQGPT